MDKVGVKKEIDALGRICIPKDIRELYSFSGEVSLILTRDGVLITNPKFKLTEISSDDADI